MQAASAQAERHCATSTSSSSTSDLPRRGPRGQCPVAKRRNETVTDNPQASESPASSKVFGDPNVAKRRVAPVTDTSLRVTHAPVNIAGIPWENVQALRRKGVDARLVVFERGKLHHEADWSLDRHGPLPQKLAHQFAAFAKLAPRTDIFHFYFGLTLVPKSIQFPLLRALRKKSLSH